jgi:hypothetical protein
MKHGSRGQGSGQRPAHACRDDGCLRVCAVAFTVGSSMARSSFRRIAKGSARNRKNAQARLAYSLTNTHALRFTIGKYTNR